MNLFVTFYLFPEALGYYEDSGAFSSGEKKYIYIYILIIISVRCTVSSLRDNIIYVPWDRHRTGCY